MPRASLKEKRRKQILDAFETCIIRYGLEGATLDKVATECGLARALIRHNVGNRQEVIEQALTRFIRRSKAETQELLAALPKTEKSRKLLDWRFDTSYVGANRIQVAFALIVACRHLPELSDSMERWTRSFTRSFRECLEYDFPGGDVDHIYAVAVGITSIYFTTENLEELRLNRTFSSSTKRAARLLIETLG